MAVNGINGHVQPLWRPTPAQVAAAPSTRFRQRINEKYGHDFQTYEELWRWSCDNIDLCWAEIWHFCNIIASKPYDSVVDTSIPMDRNPTWFPGARLNWAENMLRERSPDKIALISCVEPGTKGTSPVYTRISYAQLYDDVRRVAHALRRLGVQPLDTVTFYGPTCPEAMIACLATSSIGAIWSSTAADFGSEGVLNRFAQIKPKVLISANAVRYNGKQLSHLPKLRAVLAGLQRPDVSPNLHVVLMDFLPPTGPEERDPCWQSWTDFVATGNAAAPEIDFYQAPFDHPLWILFSSGTTGNPKAIVHRAGGMLIQSRKEFVIHGDMKPSDVYFYVRDLYSRYIGVRLINGQFTTPGWMMFNYLIHGLSLSCTLVLFDGSPLWDPSLLWRLADDLKVTIFGTSAKYVEVLSKAYIPKDHHDLSALRQILSTGSPLVADLFDWIYANIKADLIVGSITGGTDLCSLLAGHNTALPVWRGEIQCRTLGMATECWDDNGKPCAADEPGDLVCTKAFPCQPIFFWNDEGGQKYHASYFERFPQVWTHGDFCMLTPSRDGNGGGLVMLGRSDGVLNPQGVRFGSSELYSVIDAITPSPIDDALAVGMQLPSGDERVVLFLKMLEGEQLSADFLAKLKTEIRTRRSARHVPSDFIVVKDIPYTINNKKVEVPIKKLLNGHGMKAINPATLRNPECLTEYARLGDELRAKIAA